MNVKPGKLKMDDPLLDMRMVLLLLCVGLRYKSTRGETADFEVFEQTKSWRKANESCGQRGSMLAILDTPAKRTKLSNKLTNNGHYWVGLRIDDTGKEMWVNGQKANIGLAVKSNKKCATFRKNKGFDVKDCDDMKKFVCQGTTGKSTASSTKTVTSIHTSPIPHPSQSRIETVITLAHQATQTLQSISTSTSIQRQVKTSQITPSGDTPNSTTSSTPSSTRSSTTSSTPNSTANILQPSWSSRQEGKEMIEDFDIFLTKLDSSDPSSMQDLLDEYDDFVEDINTFQLQDEDFNPLLKAQTIETFAMKFAKMHLHSNRTTIKVTNKEIAFRAQVVYRSTNSNVVLPGDSENGRDFLSIPKALFKDQEETFIVGVVFKNEPIRNFTPSTLVTGSSKRMNLNTKIFSLNAYPKLKEPFQENIVIILDFIQENITNDPSRVHCSFWNYSIPSPYNGSWSTKGCSIKSLTGTHAVCECNHMTNFAVLMQLKPKNQVGEIHVIALTTITFVGLALSLVGETITVICYCIFLNASNEKIQIRINLLCSLAGAQIFILAGTSHTENKGACVFVAAVIHYLYLVSFCWMLMEAVYLYRMVVKVFHTEFKMRYSYLFSYGCPTLVVSLALFLAEFTTGGIYTYCNPNFCWVNFKNKLIWTFVAPVLLIVTINTFSLFCVIKEIFCMKSVETISSIEIKRIRASVRACVVLLPLLGITWIFGLLSLANIGVTWQYIFTILNATQGFTIFIVHCLRNTELRNAINLRYSQWESNHSNHSKQGKVTPTQNILIKGTKFTDPANSPPSSVPMVMGRVNKVTSAEQNVDLRI